MNNSHSDMQNATQASEPIPGNERQLQATSTAEMASEKHASPSETEDTSDIRTPSAVFEAEQTRQAEEQIEEKVEERGEGRKACDKPTSSHQEERERNAKSSYDLRQMIKVPRYFHKEHYA